MESVSFTLAAVREKPCQLVDSLQEILFDSKIFSIFFARIEFGSAVSDREY